MTWYEGRQWKTKTCLVDVTGIRNVHFSTKKVTPRGGRPETSLLRLRDSQSLFDTDKGSGNLPILVYVDCWRPIRFWDGTDWYSCITDVNGSATFGDRVFVWVVVFLFPIYLDLPLFSFFVPAHITHFRNEKRIDLYLNPVQRSSETPGKKVHRIFSYNPV